MNRTAQRLVVTVLGLVAVSTSAFARPHSMKHGHADLAIPGDAMAGSEVFKTRCAACHGKQAEGTALAPPLVGALGSKAASSPFAGYTTALKASGVVWSPAKLDGFLAGPAKLVPGTAMMVSVAKAEDRENLIAYLATLRK